MLLLKERECFAIVIKLKPVSKSNHNSQLEKYIRSQRELKIETSKPL